MQTTTPNTTAEAPTENQRQADDQDDATGAPIHLGRLTHIADRGDDVDDPVRSSSACLWSYMLLSSSRVRYYMKVHHC